MVKFHVPTTTPFPLNNLDNAPLSGGEPVPLGGLGAHTSTKEHNDQADDNAFNAINSIHRDEEEPLTFGKFKLLTEIQPVTLFTAKELQVEVQNANDSCGNEASYAQVEDDTEATKTTYQAQSNDMGAPPGGLLDNVEIAGTKEQEVVVEEVEVVVETQAEVQDFSSQATTTVLN